LAAACRIRAAFHWWLTDGRLPCALGRMSGRQQEQRATSQPWEHHQGARRCCCCCIAHCCATSWAASARGSKAGLSLRRHPCSIASCIRAQPGATTTHKATPQSPLSRDHGSCCKVPGSCPCLGPSHQPGPLPPPGCPPLGTTPDHPTPPPSPHPPTRPPSPHPPTGFAHAG
jgi:hypothetical protein